MAGVVRVVTIQLQQQNTEMLQGTEEMLQDMAQMFQENTTPSSLTYNGLFRFVWIEPHTCSIGSMLSKGGHPTFFPQHFLLVPSPTTNDPRTQ